MDGIRAARAMAGLALAAVLSAPAIAAGQSQGNGYMFHRPYGTLAVRGGYLAAGTSGQPYEVMRRQTTVGSRSFDAPNLAADLTVHLTNRFDLVASVEGSGRSKTVEYREWEENGEPIMHTDRLTRMSMGGSLRFNLADRGRQVSAFAWIPSRYVPYVGIGGGMMHYSLTQEGDFVEETPANTAAIYTDELKSDNWGSMVQAFSGLDYRVNARWSLVSEARYTSSKVSLTADYVGMGKIDLSGLALNFGASVRF